MSENKDRNDDNSVEQSERIDYDGAFKRMFGVPEMVADFLMTVLEPDWKHAIDMKSLVDRSNEFTPDRGTKRRGDFVWQASIDQNLTREERLQYGLDPDCNTICFYVMIEFQSTVDPKMALRVEAYEALLRLHLAETSGMPVPHIVSFVLYSGDREWNASMVRKPLVAKPLPGLTDQVYCLVDLNDPRWADNPVNNAFKIAAKLSQCETTKELNTQLRAHRKEIRSHPVAEFMIRWTYDLQYRIINGPDAEPPQLPQNIDIRELEMKVYQKLSEDFKRVCEESEARGEARGEASVLIKVMLEKYGPIPEPLREMIHETTDLARLDEMLNLTFSCETLEEFQERLK